MVFLLDDLVLNSEEHATDEVFDWGYTLIVGWKRSGATFEVRSR